MSLAGRGGEGPPKPGTGAVALLVDDDRLVRGVLARVLGHAGYAVLEAADGESALVTSARFGRRIDLLVADVYMPGISGWELADRLRGDWPRLKTLIISGAESEPSRPPGPGTGFLRKPFGPELLLEHVRRLGALE